MDLNPNIDWEISDSSTLESNAQVEFPIENLILGGENESTQGDETQNVTEEEDWNMVQPKVTILRDNGLYYLVKEKVGARPNVLQ